MNDKEQMLGCRKHRVLCGKPQHLAVQGHSVASGYQSTASDGKPGNHDTMNGGRTSMSDLPRHGARQPWHHPARSLLTICLTIWGLGLQCTLPIVLPGSPASHLGIKTSPLTPSRPAQRGSVVGKKHPSGPGGHLIPKSPSLRAPQASSPTLPQLSQALSSGISKLARPGRGAGNVNSVCLKCQ